MYHFCVTYVNDILTPMRAPPVILSPADQHRLFSFWGFELNAFGMIADRPWLPLVFE